jgi:hypothetical protein
MTYPELLTSIYKEHGTLLTLWKDRVGRSGETGVFAFLPESYVACADVKEARFEFWTGPQLTEYLSGHGSSGEGYRELEGQIDAAVEFLVFIVEPPDAGGKRPVHLHRIGPVGHN